ncbi:MAG: hypothetical protein ABSB82_18490 [Terriglobia bacterium]
MPDARIPIYPDHSAALGSLSGVSIREDAAGLGLVQIETNPGEAPVTTGGALVAAAIFAALLVGKKLLTVRHCRRFIREFVPVK